MKTMTERIESKIERLPDSGCWLWTGAINPNGYGVLGARPIPLKAHRVTYELLNGKIPDGLELDHLCRVRCCVNPHHLEPVTHKENMRRGIGGKVRAAQQAKKTHCPKGHPYAGSNLRIQNGRRHCVECQRVDSLARYYRKKSNGAGAAV